LFLRYISDDGFCNIGFRLSIIVDEETSKLLQFMVRMLGSDPNIVERTPLGGYFGRYSVTDFQINDRLSAVSYWLSVIGYQLLVINYWLSVINYQ